jgi:exonuclease SbcC
MIPLKLTLHNFMCYRDPDPVDFSGLHLACLSGNNGHGKSALLDAITWVLWSRARSNQADDLITLGEDDMWVDFEFALGPNRYRARRSRERKGRSGKSDLQLQVWQPDGKQGGEFQPITEPTIRETEARIVELLRMDYDTFINSAYLMQGRADEFTVKPPNQRKQILAEILGLSRYDAYEARAKELARQQRDEVARVDAVIQAIDNELSHEAQYAQAVQDAQARLIELGQELRQVEESQRALAAEHQQLLAQRRELADLQRRLERDRQELAAIDEQIQQATGRLAADAKLLAQAAEIEAGYQILEETRQAEQAMNAQLLQQSRLHGQRSLLEQQIGQARAQLESERRVLEERVARLQDLANRVPAWEQQRDAARVELAALATQEGLLAGLREELQKLAEENAGLRAQNEGLRVDMAAVKERLDLLKAAEATCPVCGQPLGVSEQRQVVSDYEARGQAMGDRFRENLARQQALSKAVSESQAQIAAAERAVRDKSGWQRQEAQAEAQLTEAMAALSQLEPALQALTQLDARLEDSDFAHEPRNKLAAIDEELAILGYDAASHEAVRERLLAHEPYRQRYSQLQAARERGDTLRQSIEQMEASRERRREALADDEAHQALLLPAVERLPQLETELRSSTAQVEAAVSNERHARQIYGAAQQRLEACRSQAGRRLELSHQVQALREEQAVYEELQAAFGKKGLQAMIIEAAIPEIEIEANKLLGRMTDGRMSVRLETQRETKTSQEVRETLDIILSDELGSRDYALFSGGEAFRANLAIRIALSKLLARRAGAELQTLIVDEGFGTQDAQGRERLVQAITSIQDDFERVLVITHIDELKDHFPARIDVVKTESGSQISLG